LNKFFLVVLGACLIAICSAACEAVPFVAQNQATATPTRRVRPTFTPKPRATPTEIEPTEEPQPTDEPVQEATDEPTEAEPTDKPAPTQRPVTRAPAKPTNPPAPPPPSKPQFSVTATSKYMCAQDGIFEVVVNAKKGRAFLEGLAFAAFDSGGRLVQNGAGKDLIGVTEPASVSIGSNCQVDASFDSPNISNGKIDVSDAVRQGVSPIVVKFVKSPTDLTPISADIPIDFGAGGRYWIFSQSQ
jgi:hypothetical protein